MEKSLPKPTSSKKVVCTDQQNDHESGNIASELSFESMGTNARGLVGCSLDDTEHGRSPEFGRWRPKYHFIAAQGWMNDPCGPCYNPVTKSYHLGFQWNPKSHEWGNISWGYGLSKDLVSWEISSIPSLQPSPEVDVCGVFTGCIWPTNLHGETDGSMVCFYTSANDHPIHWSLPYVRRSERVHLATSTDNGRSWHRFQGNPIIPEPPLDIQVTGWRDPYVAPWESVSKALSRDPNKWLWGLVSGGIKDKTPTTFLYAIDNASLEKWEYIGPLINLGLKFQRSRWSGDFGINWEVTNFLTLTDESGRSHDFLIMGVEGCPSSSQSQENGNLISTRAQMWMCGHLQVVDGELTMQYRYGGLLDHGCFYAGNSFWDPITKKQIIFGWVDEEALPKEYQKRQSWAGMLALPRVLTLLTLPCVCGALKSELHMIDSVEMIPDDKGTYTIQTLAALPDSRLLKLRRERTSLPAQALTEACPELSFSQGLAQFELDVSFSVNLGVSQIGLSISHSADGVYKTVIVFDIHTETIKVDRFASSCIEGVDLTSESAPHTLFKTDDGSGQVHQESLDIHIYYDVSIFEIFINKRTSITTRVYPMSGMVFAVRPFVEYLDQDGVGSLKHCHCWALSS